MQKEKSLSTSNMTTSNQVKTFFREQESMISQKVKINIMEKVLERAKWVNKE
jgi:hypothetical protein